MTRRFQFPTLVACIAFFGVCALVLVCALPAAVALWRAGLPVPPVDTAPGLAVVFFDADVETTLPRAEKALELVRSGRVNQVFLVGGARPDRGFYGSAVLAEIMAAREGASAARWVADRDSSDTVSNLAALRSHLAENEPSGPVYLVSDDYHLWRIAWFVASDPGALGDAVFTPGDEPRGISVHVERTIWEIGAWLSLVVPASLRERALTLTRS
ncbi:MAG: YdcF family protein [Microvirga sp.]|nr:YdcF family protein [Microvirga sp.]